MQIRSKTYRTLFVGKERITAREGRFQCENARPTEVAERESDKIFGSTVISKPISVLKAVITKTQEADFDAEIVKSFV